MLVFFSNLVRMDGVCIENIFTDEINGSDEDKMNNSIEDANDERVRTLKDMKFAPCTSMKFNLYDEAYAFYNSYANEAELTLEC